MIKKIDRLGGVVVSRAAFLRACGAALLGAHAGPLALLEAAARPSIGAEPAPAAGGFQLPGPNAQLFRQHLDTPFTVGASGHARVGLVLAEVAERPLTGNVEQFSLIFHAPAGTTVPQGTYTLRHRALGDLDVFIAPIGAPGGRRTVYQACFSRHLSAQDVVRAPAAIPSPSRRI